MAASEDDLIISPTQPLEPFNPYPGPRPERKGLSGLFWGSIFAVPEVGFTKNFGECKRRFMDFEKTQKPTPEARPVSSALRGITDVFNLPGGELLKNIPNDLEKLVNRMQQLSDTIKPSDERYRETTRYLVNLTYALSGKPVDQNSYRATLDKYFEEVQRLNPNPEASASRPSF